MVILHKKRIQMIVFCIIVGVFAFSFQIANQNERKKEIENSIETVATPVSGKTVIIDAGHGKPDERCTK